MAGPRRPLNRPIVSGLAAIAAVALIGCSAVSPPPTTSYPPATGQPPVQSQPPASAPGSGAPSVFDPAAVSISLQSFASVPGGPLAITAPQDGSGRLFVAAQDGRAWVVDHGTTRATPLLDIRNLVTSGGERGLLGLAIHPGFPGNPRVYVDYTDLNGNTVIASYRLDPSDPNRLDPTSAAVILQVVQPYANHNGGALAFGPDGDLYVSLGDGGSEGDPQGYGQRLDTLLGKILRIDVDHPAGGKAYGIPAGNPFVGRTGAEPEIWLYGLRNPWRLAFDRATGDLWIGDVGQNSYEEVDVARAGASGLNFGWNVTEGDHCFHPTTDCDATGITLPVVEYGHDVGCVVIGGPVYRGTSYPILHGGYLYADYCSGRIWALDAASASPVVAAPAAVQVGTTGAGLAAFGEDGAGEVYAANLDGTISQVIAAAR
jgi:glucose/arabinose dehydrogenase